MALHADRAHAGTAAAMRYGEGLVEVEVADVGADVAGAGQADHGIHVRAVEIDLTTVLVGDVANLAHRLLEHAMRGRIGDHGAGEVFRMLLRLGAEIGDVDIAVLENRDRTTVMPAIWADAGFVPWAEVGMRQIWRCAPPLAL